MTIEIRAGAGRAARRVLGFWVVGGYVVTAALIPLVFSASSGSLFEGSALWSFLVVGAIVWLGAALLSSVFGFAASRDARRAAASLRVRDPSAEIHYGRLAPEHGIVALTAEPGKVVAWVADGDRLVALSEVTDVDAVALTAEKIWGFYYYALDIRSPGAAAVVTVGTKATWGAAEASRKAHLRLAARLLGTPDGLRPDQARELSFGEQRGSATSRDA
jgi:hypothetical protein